MPKYVLHYFNAKGRAEIARLLFKAAGVEFEDVRHTREEWPAVKPTMPLGHIPVLFIDGEPLSETAAINRYLANEFGLYGKDNMERARIDECVECLNDIGFSVMIFHKEEDETRKAEFKKDFVENKLKTILTNFQTLLKRNKDGQGFCIGDKLSVADLVFLNYCDWLPMLAPNAFDDFPRLAELQKKVSAVPNIAAWLESRPKTGM